MAKTEESKLEQAVSAYMVRRRVWQLARYQAQSNQNGLPDRLYLYKGYLLGFELKTDNGKPTLLQEKKLELINANGGIGLIIRRVEEIAKVLDLIDAYSSLSDNSSSLILKQYEEWKDERSDNQTK